MLTLPTAGPKFWRVRSFQGVINTAGTAAATAWSPTGTFTIADGPLRVSTITLLTGNLASGQETLVDLQLNRAVPAAGATVTLVELEPAGGAAARVRRGPGLDVVRCGSASRRDR